MVKRMTFNHSHKGSSPLDLKKKNIYGYRLKTNISANHMSDGL